MEIKINKIGTSVIEVTDAYYDEPNGRVVTFSVVNVFGDKAYTVDYNDFVGTYETLAEALRVLRHRIGYKAYCQFIERFTK